MDDRERRIIDVLIALQPGEVTTYGDVADMAGYPKHSRLVGRLLQTTDVDVPWWRVVNASGRLVPGHEREQAGLLLARRRVDSQRTREIGAPRPIQRRLSVGRVSRRDRRSRDGLAGDRRCTTRPTFGISR